MRLIGAAVVLLALALAPSPAAAHAGHHHLQDSGIAKTVAGTAIEAGCPNTVKAQSPAELRSSSTLPVVDIDAEGTPCPGAGCCNGAACSACSAVVAPDSPADIYSPVHFSFDFSNAPARSGLGPDGIRRPPRSFA
jgi:hypothetical protein